MTEHEDFSEALRLCRASKYNNETHDLIESLRELLGLDASEAEALLGPLPLIFATAASEGADPFASLFLMGVQFAETLRDVRRRASAGTLRDVSPRRPGPRFGVTGTDGGLWFVVDLERDVVVGTWQSFAAAEADAANREANRERRS